MSNVISLQKYRDKREFDGQNYRNMLQSLHKAELLHEMVKFNDELQETGYTKVMCQKGTILFGLLLQTCETPEMNILCKQMLTHLGAK